MSIAQFFDKDIFKWVSKESILALYFTFYSEALSRKFNNHGKEDGHVPFHRSKHVD